MPWAMASQRSATVRAAVFAVFDGWARLVGLVAGGDHCHDLLDDRQATGAARPARGGVWRHRRLRPGRRAPGVARGGLGRSARPAPGYRLPGRAGLHAFKGVKCRADPREPQCPRAAAGSDYSVADPVSPRRNSVSFGIERRSVASIAFLVFADGLRQVVLRKVGPMLVEEDQLAVGGLPEQEVADALLAARSDHQIRVRNTPVDNSAANRSSSMARGSSRPAAAAWARRRTAANISRRPL